MNWVGGVRKRIQLNDSRTQEEGYFGKRRMEERIQSVSERPGILKKDPVSSFRPLDNFGSFSQDLFSLQTLIQSEERGRDPSRIHKATEVSLDKPFAKAKYQWKTPQHCKLPESPIGTPSKLLLSSPEGTPRKQAISDTPHFFKSSFEQTKPVQPTIVMREPRFVYNRSEHDFAFKLSTVPTSQPQERFGDWKMNFSFDNQQHQQVLSSRASNPFLMSPVKSNNPFCLSADVGARAGSVAHVVRTTRTITTTHTVNQSAGFFGSGGARPQATTRSQQTQTENMSVRDAAMQTETIFTK